MATCDECNATLGLYEYNRIGDKIICDNCAKQGIRTQRTPIASPNVSPIASVSPVKPQNSITAPEGFMLFEHYETESEAKRVMAQLEAAYISVQLREWQKSVKASIRFYLFVDKHKLTEANSLINRSAEGETMLLRSAPMALLIRRLMYVLLFALAPVFYNQIGLYFVFFGFMAMTIALTKDKEFGAVYMCSNRNCRAVNRKGAQFCHHCGAHFSHLEFNEGHVERFKKKEWTSRA